MKLGMTQNQNQHYVSQVLLRQFTSNGLLQRYDVIKNRWKRVSPKQVFSRLGYTQLSAYGTFDNSLEESFSKIETSFPATLHELDKAGQNKNTEVPAKTLDNLFWYCAYLWRMSPFAKAVAPLEYVLQLNMDLDAGRTTLLHEIGIGESDINSIKKLYKEGKRFIVSDEDECLQIFFRMQFVRKCKDDYVMLRHFTKWSLYHSPIELAVSDVAFFNFYAESAKLYFSILPLSPKLLLIGKRKAGVQLERSTSTSIPTDSLNLDEAEYFLDAIYLSAITAIACKNQIGNVPDMRRRAIEKKIRFAKIKNLDVVLSAGLKEIQTVPRVLPVNKEAFIQFKKSFIEN